MDGEEVARRLKSDPGGARLPVLAVSAYAMPSDEQRMREAGCDAFLTKPLRLANLVETVAGMLRRSPSGGD
jgi:two-component system cell cycle response regulator DivK